MKRIISFVIGVLVVMSLVSLTACEKRNNTERRIVMWTFMNHIEGNMVEQFAKSHDNVEVEVVVYPEDTYYTKLHLALQSGRNVPDIYQIERTHLGDFIDGEDSQYMYDLSSLGGDEYVKGMIPYVSELGRNDENKLLGICDHTNVAGLNFNKEAALKYLGTSDYHEIQNMVTSWDDVVTLSKEVSDKGGFLVASLEDLITIEKYNNGYWVENNKFVINDSWNDVIDLCRNVRNNCGDAGLIFWTDAYESAKVEGNVIFWTGTFDNYVDDSLYNKWGAIAAPKPYYFGGTYNFIYNKSENVDVAYDFLKFISGDEWQKYDVTKRAVMPSSERVYEVFAGKGVWAATGDQPVLDLYHEIAESIEPNKAKRYEESIYLIFEEEVLNGIDGNASNDEILERVTEKTRIFYPELF